MALSLTDDEKTTLCYAFGWFITDLDEQITYVSEHITTDMNTRIQTDIATLKTDLTKDHITIEPTEANFGARVRLGTKAQKLALRIASAMAIPASELNLAGSVRLSRG